MGRLRFLLVGHPVTHSLSPVMHTAAMESAGIEGTYDIRETDADGLQEAVQALRDGAIHGVNVTMPLKRDAFRLADLVTPEAECAGSVNTLRLSEGKVEGHSTDVTAMAALAGSLCPRATEALVLGGGGAAQAILCALGDRRIYVSARDPQQAEATATSSPGSQVLAWGSGVAGAILVNATPLGMRGEDLPGIPLAAAAGLVDLAYGAAETPAVARARTSGLPVADGVEFLSLAASASLAWWTGAHVHSTVMLEAARKTQENRR